MKTKLDRLIIAAWASAALATFNLSAAVCYVDVNSATPTPPYTNWTTAAVTIQQAVDVALAGDEIVVTNGSYVTGGRTMVDGTTNRVVVNKPVAVRSVNGPQFTVIQGYQVPGTTNGISAIRCVWLTNGASLSGFTLTNGATQTGGAGSGGGVRCNGATAVLTNCVLTGNSAAFTGGGASSGTLKDCKLIGNSSWLQGGGAYVGRLNNCILTGNSAGTNGGGSACSGLNNCTLTGNLAVFGGGGYRGFVNPSSSNFLNNCIVYYNSASDGANYYQGQSDILNYCCTTPLPTNGIVNITNAPLFVDYAGGNLRLQANSPCINAGLNAYAPGPTDLDGLPRIVSGTVDIGAYEFQGPGSVISYAWLQQYGLPIDGSADATDPDADGHTTWQEWRCLTDPTDPLSVLRLLSATRAGTNVTVSWQSVAGVSYFLERTTDLMATPLFTPLASGIPGHSGTTSFTDTNAAAASQLFYRVGVGN